MVREFFGEGLDAGGGQRHRKRPSGSTSRPGRRSRKSRCLTPKYGMPAYYIVASAECSSNLARYDGTTYGHRAADFSPQYPGEENLAPMVRMMMASRAEGFGAEVKRRIMLGTFALSAGYADQYYNKALQVRRKIRGDFDAAFREVDVVLGPTSPTPAFKLGERTADPLAMYLSDIYTITANLAGIPGISIPCGLTKSGLPIGLQLLAAPFAEEKLLRTARVFERATDWHRSGRGWYNGGRSQILDARCSSWPICKRQRTIGCWMPKYSLPQAICFRHRDGNLFPGNPPQG